MRNYDFDFNFILSYWEPFLKGFVVTLELSLSTIVLSTIIGITLGIIMTRENWTLRQSSIFLVDSIRSMPAVVILLISYYSFPTLGLRTDPFWPALLALSIDGGVFLGDIIRGGISGIPKGGVLAAKTLGMNTALILRRIILPEVLRETLPTITLTYINMIKWTSLASIITVKELTHTSSWVMSSTFKPLEVYLFVAIIYVITIFPMIRLSRKFETSTFFKRRSI